MNCLKNHCSLYLLLFPHKSSLRKKICDGSIVVYMLVMRPFVLSVFSFLAMLFWLSTGLSLKSQELTALFLATRLYCSFVMEYDIHTLLDFATLATTAWVIYMIRFVLKSTYMDDKDNFAHYHVVCVFSLLQFLYFFIFSRKLTVVVTITVKYHH